MVDPSFFDAFVGYQAGFLPGLQDVTIKLPNGNNPGGSAVTMNGRIEGTTDQQRIAAVITADEEAVTWFFGVDQPNYVRLYVGWKIVQSDGRTWIVRTSDETIQQRALACVCTRTKS